MKEHQCTREEPNQLRDSTVIGTNVCMCPPLTQTRFYHLYIHTLHLNI